MNNYVDPNETRTQEQRDQYEKINKDGVCPFCGDNFTKFHKSEILKENKNWLITTNDHPYEGTKQHLLIVYRGKGHIISPDELSKKAKLDLFKLIRWANKEFNINSAGFVMRYGGPGNGSSVRHLHAHIISGETNKKSTEKVSIKVGYKNTLSD